MESTTGTGVPKAAASVFETFLGLLSSYGWHLLFFAVIVNLLYTHFKPKIQKWMNDRHDRQQAEEYQQNPEILYHMQMSMVQSRQRMQEEQDRLAQEHLEKKKQLEKEKQEEKIKKWQCVQKGSSYSVEKTCSESTSNSTESQSKSTDSKLREQNYNPLMGSGSGASYRPSRRCGGNTGG